MKEGTKKVLYILANFPCYSETFILREMDALRRKGYQLTILALRNPREKVIQPQVKDYLASTYYLEYMSWPIVRAQLASLACRPCEYLGLWGRIILTGIKKPMVLLKNLAVLPGSIFAGLYFKDKIDHIHAHFANYPATAALLASWAAGASFTFTAHAHDIFADTTLLEFKAQRAKKVITISDYNKRFILQACPALREKDIQVIRCGLETHRFERTPPGKSEAQGLTILSVGRLTPPKGMDTLIQACKILKERKVPYQAKIIGEGPEEPRLKKLVHALGLEKQVFLVGPKTQPEVSSLYEEADMLVLACRRYPRHPDVQDGIPVVLIEAMARGIPVVSTPISGIPELVIDRQTGLLAQPEQPEALAEAMEKLARSPVLRRDLGSRAQTKVFSEYNIDKGTERLIAIFAS